MPAFVFILLIFLLLFLWMMRPIWRMRRFVRDVNNAMSDAQSQGAKRATKDWSQARRSQQKGRYVDYEEIPGGEDDFTGTPAQPQTTPSENRSTPTESRIKDAEYEEIP